MKNTGNNIMGRWGKSLRIFFTLALLVPLLGVFSLKSDIPAHAHPLLLEQAASQPHQTVSVIVQKQTDGIENEAVRLGGTITADLEMINAFAADMTAEAAVRLSRMSGVRWVSPDAAMHSDVCTTCVNTRRLIPTSYTRVIGADRLWNGNNGTPQLQGQDITVVVIDSGIAAHNDLQQTVSGGGTRIVTSVRFNSAGQAPEDFFGHGTHVAGLIGGNGSRSGGIHIGVAPRVNLINLKVGDDQGNAHMRDVVTALQWVYNNKARYNIRVVNMSLSSGIAEPYHVSPLDAAVELLWFNRVVVVVSAGNQQVGQGTGVLYPPANDPFVITVGAADNMGTADPADDRVAGFSSYGVTQTGQSKPDLVAPGVDIVGLTPSTNAILYQQHPTHRESGYTGANHYFRMSGTSMSAPIVAGTVALMLQDEPNLTPDQIKFRLKATARNIQGPGGGAGQLDAYRAVTGLTMQSANTGTPASLLIAVNGLPLIWDSVSWNTVNWNTVNWNTVNWNTVNWNADYWDE